MGRKNAKFQKPNTNPDAVYLGREARRNKHRRVNEGAHLEGVLPKWKRDKNDPIS
jgi:hypothetical protein